MDHTVESYTVNASVQFIRTKLYIRQSGKSLININTAVNCSHTTNSYSHLYLLFAKNRDPKATTVTKMAQVASRRTANHRVVVKNKNQASGFVNHNKNNG